MYPKEFEDYLKNTYQDQINYYDKKSMRNKRLYLICKILIIVVSFSVPIMVAYDLHKDILVVLSSIVAILSAIVVAFRFYENWMNYRSTCESLKKEKPHYDFGVGPYENIEDKEGLFVKRVEALISREHTEWLSDWRNQEGMHP